MSDHTENTTAITIKQAIDGFLLSCKVEGKSYGTIEHYKDKLKGFFWYAINYDWPARNNRLRVYGHKEDCIRHSAQTTN